MTGDQKQASPQKTGSFEYPFGLLPERCLNGKGRVIGERKSYWVELKPADVGKTLSLLSLVLSTDGVIRRTINTTFSGYDAVNKRSEILSYPSQAAYIDELRSSLGQMEIVSYEISHLEDLSKEVQREALPR